MKRDIPILIPLGTTEELEGDLKILNPGQFTAQIHLFIEDAGLQEIVLLVKGQGVEQE